MKIKTIDVNAKEWFDKANGNSYFSAVITLNFGMDNAISYSLPFQYGYGEHYLSEAMQLLMDKRLASTDYHLSLWRWCEANGIILRYSKQENCLKRDVISWGS